MKENHGKVQLLILNPPVQSGRVNLTKFDVDRYKVWVDMIDLMLDPLGTAAIHFTHIEDIAEFCLYVKSHYQYMVVRK